MIVGEPIFEVAPEAFHRIELWRIGWEEEQPDLNRQAQPLSFVKGSMVEPEEVEALGSHGGEVVEEELKELSLESRQFEQEALAGQGFNRSLQVEALKAKGGGPQGRYPAGGEVVAGKGQHPTATFVLRPQPTRAIAVLLGGLPPFLDLPGPCRLKLGHLLSLIHI